MGIPGAVLVIDSGADSADWVCEILCSHGIEIRRAPARLAPSVAAGPPRASAAVLDLVTPGLDGRDGLDVIGAVRAATGPLPMLVLSALGHADERVRILRTGVEAVLTKPVGAGELVMRLRQIAAPVPAAPLLRCADLTLDAASGRVERAGRTLELTPRERALLEVLLRHRGEVVTRTVLLEAVWSYRFDPNASLVDTHVSRLRRKIDGGFPRPLLHTRRRLGYKLADNP